MSDQRKCLLGVAGAHHKVPGVLQVESDQFLDRRFIFDKQDGCGHGVGLAPVAKI
jgi:hypothetical protein